MMLLTSGVLAVVGILYAIIEWIRDNRRFKR